MSSCMLIPSLEPINRSDVDKRKSVRNLNIFKRLAPTDADRLGESGSLPQLLHQSGQKQTFPDLNEHRNSSETVTTKSTSKKCSEHFRTVFLHLETYRWMGLKHSKTVRSPRVKPWVLKPFPVTFNPSYRRAPTTASLHPWSTLEPTATLKIFRYHIWTLWFGLVVWTTVI
jgi:hypothetical protein